MLHSIETKKRKIKKIIHSTIAVPAISLKQNMKKWQITPVTLEPEEEDSCKVNTNKEQKIVNSFPRQICSQPMDKESEQNTKYQLWKV